MSSANNNKIHSDWIVKKSRSQNGRLYYVNFRTKTSTWERPECLSEQLRQPLYKNNVWKEVNLPQSEKSTSVLKPLVQSSKKVENERLQGKCSNVQDNQFKKSQKIETNKQTEKRNYVEEKIIRLWEKNKNRQHQKGFLSGDGEGLVGKVGKSARRGKLSKRTSPIDAKDKNQKIVNYSSDDDDDSDIKTLHDTAKEQRLGEKVVDVHKRSFVPRSVQRANQISKLKKDEVQDTSDSSEKLDSDNNQGSDSLKRQLLKFAIGTERAKTKLGLSPLNQTELESERCPVLKKVGKRLNDLISKPSKARKGTEELTSAAEAISPSCRIKPKTKQKSRAKLSPAQVSPNEPEPLSLPKLASPEELKQRKIIKGKRRSLESLYKAKKVKSNKIVDLPTSKIPSVQKLSTSLPVLSTFDQVARVTCDQTLAAPPPVYDSDDEDVDMLDLTGEISEEETEMEYEVYSLTWTCLNELDTSVNVSSTFMVVDTNVLISDLDVVKRLSDPSIYGPECPLVVIPWVVLQELDGLKDSYKRLPQEEALEKRKNVMAPIKYLFHCFKGKHPKIVGQTASEAASKVVQFETQSNDDKILKCCLQWRHKYPECQVILLTNDINLCTKAMVSGISSYTAEGIESELPNLSSTKSETGRGEMYSGSILRMSGRVSPGGMQVHETTRVPSQTLQTSTTMDNSTDDIPSEADSDAIVQSVFQAVWSAINDYSTKLAEVIENPSINRNDTVQFLSKLTKVSKQLAVDFQSILDVELKDMDQYSGRFFTFCQTLNRFFQDVNMPHSGWSVQSSQLKQYFINNREILSNGLAQLKTMQAVLERCADHVTEDETSRFML